MPLDPTLFAVFLAAVLAICFTPGPDMLYVLANGVNQGSKAGIVSALGMAAGMLVHTLAAGAGLSALFEASPLAFEIVRYVGAAYLVWLAWKAFGTSSLTADIGSRQAVALPTIFWRATVTNLLNPKIVLFYVAFLPQFIDPDLGQVVLQFVLLGLVFVALGLAVDLIVGVFGGQVGDWLLRRQVAARFLNIFAGVVFAGLAVRLVLF